MEEFIPYIVVAVVSFLFGWMRKGDKGRADTQDFIDRMDDAESK